jgi:hypothetical protein
MVVRVLAPILAAILAALPAMGLAQDDARRMTEEARRVSIRLLDQIRGELTKEMERSGPLRSIIVCKYSAPELTSAASRQAGYRVTRVSLRPRNPALGTPDAWEQQAMLDFEKRLARGDKVETFEHVEVVTEPMGRFFRYIKAIPMGQPCLTCHGPNENISEALKAQIGVEYPNDKAVDFKPGQVRGAITIKRQL